MLTIKKNSGQTNTNAKGSIGFLAETPLKKNQKQVLFPFENFKNNQFNFKGKSFH
jgi:hypothetical protein